MKLNPNSAREKIRKLALLRNEFNDHLPHQLLPQKVTENLGIYRIPSLSLESQLAYFRY